MRKYCALTKVSKATATRDLHALAQAGAFVPSGGGRSVRYELNL
jgi:Fic family protein